MDWTGKRVLVTGAGGFIGSQLTEKLAELGASPRAFVRYVSNGSEGWLEKSPFKHNIEIIRGDICDRDSVEAAVQGVDIVFHLAALIAIPYSYHLPESYIRTNVLGTLNILQAAKSFSIERFVHTSTSEVYGTAQYVPIDERHPLQGQSPYSASKIGADKLVESFHLSFNFPAVTIRPFNTFGPRQSARAIIPTIISQCLNKSTIQLGNLEPIRDFNYVTDTVEGFLLAASQPKVVGHTINIGSGQEIRIRDLVDMVGQILGRPIKIESDPKRSRPEQSEVDRLLANNSLARDLLGWQPKVSLKEGLQLTASWIQKRLDSFDPNAYVL